MPTIRNWLIDIAMQFVIALILWVCWQGFYEPMRLPALNPLQMVALYWFVRFGRTVKR